MAAGFSTGTVFREPILCKNIPRLIPGMIISYCGSIFLLEQNHVDCCCFQAGQSQYALEDMLSVISIEQLMLSLKDLGN